MVRSFLQLANVPMMNSGWPFKKTKLLSLKHKLSNSVGERGVAARSVAVEYGLTVVIVLFFCFLKAQWYI